MALRDTLHVEGVAELSRKLDRLESRMAAKALRGAATSAMLPTFRRAQQTIPIGKEPHRTYKGRLVAPGFARRSLRRVSRVSRGGGSVSVRIGVRREAFYVIQFLEKGTSKYPADHGWYLHTTQRIARSRGGLKKNCDGEF